MKRHVGAATVLAVVIGLLPASVAVASEHGDCGDPYTRIYDIQGDGLTSPFENDVVTTEGVVTVVRQDGSNEIRGFFIQDPDGDSNVATSDGIFVSHGSFWSPTFLVEVGDRVRVKGTVDEQSFSTSFWSGNTQIEFLDAASFCGSGDIKPTNTDVRTYNANNERFEGMLVRFKKDVAVTDTFNLERSGEVWLGEKSVVKQPTNVFGAAGPNALALANDNMARSFLLDDGLRFPNSHDGSFYHDNGTLRLGDTTKLIGAVWFDFHQFRIVANDGAVDFRETNTRPSAPVVGGQLSVGSFNVLNYWTTLGGRGASSAEQRAVQTEKLVAAILGMRADIVALQEVENIAPDNTPIETLVAALNAASPSNVWAWTGPAVEGYNAYPIRNEIVYRTDRVEAVGPAHTLRHQLFDDVPAGRSDSLGRNPLAQVFSVDLPGNGSDATFTVMVNHLKSKGCNSQSAPADTDQNDGQSCYNATRVAQAELVLGFVDDMIDLSGDSDVLVVGDMNAYTEEDPIDTLETELVNLVTKYNSDDYSYNFFAGFAAPWIGRGSLDHALATSSMSTMVTTARTWHINADEPRFLDWFNPGLTAPGPYRSSDHDPVMIGLSLGGRN